MDNFILNNQISSQNSIVDFLKFENSGSFFDKVGLSPSKSWFNLLHWKAFKNDGKCFLFHIKLFSLSEYLNVCPDFFGHGEK